MSEVLIGQATPEQIAEWKAKYPSGIYAVKVDGHIGYFKNPNLTEVNNALSKSSDTLPLAVVTELAGLTLIGGSEMLLTDDQMFLGITGHIRKALNGKTAELVNV